MKIFVKLIGFFAFLVIIGFIVSCDVEESEPYFMAITSVMTKHSI